MPSMNRHHGQRDAVAFEKSHTSPTVTFLNSQKYCTNAIERERWRGKDLIDWLDVMDGYNGPLQQDWVPGTRCDR